MVESQTRDVKFLIEQPPETIPKNKTRPEVLKKILDEEVCDLLQINHHGLCLASYDIDEPTAKVIREINKNYPKLPIVMWVVLPEEDGYYISEKNIDKAKKFTQKLENWINNYSLEVTGFGFDIEPPLEVIKEMQKNLALGLIKRKSDILTNKIKRSINVLANKENPQAFSQAINDLITDIKHKGISTEAYVPPSILAKLYGLNQKLEAHYTFAMVYSTFAKEPISHRIPTWLKPGQYPLFGVVGIYSPNDLGNPVKEAYPGEIPRLNTGKELKRDIISVTKMGRKKGIDYLEHFRILALTGPEVIKWTDEAIQEALKI